MPYYRASDRLRKKVKFGGFFRDRFAEIFGANFAGKNSCQKTANFMGIFWANFGRNQWILH